MALVVTGLQSAPGARAQCSVEMALKLVKPSACALVLDLALSLRKFAMKFLEQILIWNKNVRWEIVVIGLLSVIGPNVPNLVGQVPNTEYLNVSVKIQLTLAPLHMVLEWKRMYPALEAALLKQERAIPNIVAKIGKP